MDEKKRVNPAILVLTTAVVLLIGFGILSFAGKSRAEQEAKDYKAKYDSLVLKNNKTEEKLADYKSQYESLVEEINKSQQEAEAYQTSYNEIVSYMLEDGILAENLGNLTQKVWANAIYQTADSETDKYTKKNGKFVSDFNDALANLFNDKAYSDDMDKLATNQNEIREMMKYMLTPPEGFENAFNALEAMYNSYISFTNIVLRCDGSLNSFSEEFSKADVDLSKKYNAAELYVK